ncbi:MAG: TetR/AcrR family transcriptional regulator [Burkholderiales bacterium]
MARRIAKGAEAPYHHGALRDALLAAAESLLSDVGLEGFTLRECARRAGVSHGAPAHHFGDVRGLLTAFAAQSFDQLEALTRAYMDAARPGAYERLVANGLAYLDYALAHPARFRLMFRSERLDDRSEALQQSATGVLRHFESCMRGVLDAAGRPESDLTACTTLAWTLVHGLATLMLDNRMFARQVGEREQAQNRFIEMMQMTRSVFEGKLPTRRT